MKMKAFGEKVSRDEAVQIMINDLIDCINNPRNTGILKALLLFGWKGFEEWTDVELEDFISEFYEES